VIAGDTEKNVRFSDRTRRKVLEESRKIGYRPNRAARAMRTGRFESIGLLIRQNSKWMNIPIPLLDGLSSTLSSNSFRMNILEESVDEFAKYSPGAISEVLKEMMVDGLIVSCWGGVPGLQKKIVEETALPVVWLNAKYGFNCVYPDNKLAGRLATEHLLAMGHTRIAYADLNYNGHFSGIDRLAGYKSAMASSGLSPEVFIERIPRPERVKVANEIFGSLQRPTAIVTYGGNSALPILYCAIRMGIDIPRELSLITIGVEVQNSIGIEISTLLEEVNIMGIEAAKMLFLRAKSDGKPVPSVTLPLVRIKGQTCAPPSSSRILKKK